MSCSEANILIPNHPVIWQTLTREVQSEQHGTDFAPISTPGLLCWTTDMMHADADAGMKEEFEKVSAKKQVVGGCCYRDYVHPSDEHGKGTRKSDEMKKDEQLK